MAPEQLIGGVEEARPRPPERTVAKKEFVYSALWWIIAPLHLAPPGKKWQALPSLTSGLAVNIFSSPSAYSLSPHLSVPPPRLLSYSLLLHPDTQALICFSHSLAPHTPLDLYLNTFTFPAILCSFSHPHFHFFFSEIWCFYFFFQKSDVFM